MANWSVTHTFSNSTTADATQVNTNFTDLVNCSSDGTKDMSISALTCAGTVTCNGNVTLGNASGDDLTITASLASTISIKTTNSYDIGSATIALRSIYLASSDSAARSTRVIGATVASSWTMTLPTSAGTSRYRLETDGSGTTSWQPVRRSPSDAQNYSISCSVGSNALTIALKGADGNDPSSTNPVDIVFRNSTSATGTPNTRTVTSALSTTISSGSTAGHSNAVAQYIYVYALDNSGTVELAWSSTLFDDSTIQTTTAEGGGGAADTATTLYSTTARSNVPIRLIGRLSSNQTTAGTWASVPTEISLLPFYSAPTNYRTKIISSPVTPAASGYFTTLGLTITTPNIPGSRWLFQGHINFYYTGSFAEYSLCQALWCAADGANDGSTPTALTTIFGDVGSNYQIWANAAIAHVFVARATDIIVGGNQAVYLVPYAQMTTAASAQITGQIIATRIE